MPNKETQASTQDYRYQNTPNIPQTSQFNSSYSTSIPREQPRQAKMQSMPGPVSNYSMKSYTHHR